MYTTILNVFNDKTNTSLQQITDSCFIIQLKDHKKENKITKEQQVEQLFV